MSRVEIDLNLRVENNWTLAGFEDVYPPGNVKKLQVGQAVEVFEGETGIHGPGVIKEIDHRKQLLTIEVPWSELRN